MVFGRLFKGCRAYYTGRLVGWEGVCNVHIEIRQSMSTLMDMMNETKVTMGWELHQQGVPKTHIAQRLGKHRETIHLWIKGLEREGLSPF